MDSICEREWSPRLNGEPLCWALKIYIHETEETNETIDEVILVKNTLTFIRSGIYKSSQVKRWVLQENEYYTYNVIRDWNPFRSICLTKYVQIYTRFRGVLFCCGYLYFFVDSNYWLAHMFQGYWWPKYQWSNTEPLLWRLNGRNGVSNHQPQDCLLNRLFRHRSKKTSKLCVTGPCEGNSVVTGEFPAQRARNAEMFPFNDVIMYICNNPWWRHQMETFSALLALCAENSVVTGEFPSQTPATRSFDVFFNLYMNTVDLGANALILTSLQWIHTKL